EDPSHVPGVDRSGAAEREERVTPQILAALDAMHAGRSGHVLVDHAGDAPGGPGTAEAHRTGHALLDHATGRLHVEPHAPTQEEARVEVAQQEIGVGDGRPTSAGAVRGGPGVGARAVGPDLEQPHAIHARDGAAPGADLDQLHHRYADRQAGPLLEAIGARDLELPRELWLAAIDD